MVFFSSRISPFTSHGGSSWTGRPRPRRSSLRRCCAPDRSGWSPMAFTLSVRSFQVPATPFTLACPPSLPSVPTSRATRVTSEAKEASCSTMVFTTLPMRRNSPRSARPSISTRHGLRQVALGDRADHARDFGGRLDHVLDQLVERAQLGVPAAGGTADMAALVDLAFLADDPRQPLEFVRHLLFEDHHLVEQHGDFPVDREPFLLQPDSEIAFAKGCSGHSPECGARAECATSQNSCLVLPGARPSARPQVGPKRGMKAVELGA